MTKITKEDVQDEKISRRTPVVEHITLLRVSWMIEIAGYFFLFSIVILALSGVFSSGVLSEREAISDGGLLKVNYERFARNGKQTQIKIQVKSESNQPVTISLSSELMDYYLMENIQPQSVQVTHMGRKLLFTLPKGLQQQWYTFTFILRSKEWGGLHTTVNGPEGNQIVIKQWIYP